MQRRRDKTPVQTTQSDEIDTIERPQIQIRDLPGSLLSHEKIERPGKVPRCGMCGRPWPCSR